MQAMRCFFAPMEGITGALFRRTHRRFFPGVDRYFMPFLSPSQHHVFTRRELRDILPEQDGDLDAVPRYHIVKDIGIIQSILPIKR